VLFGHVIKRKKNKLKHAYTGEPKLPILLEDEYDNRGWDIPTKYGVDSDFICWMNMAHGDACQPTTVQSLVEDMDKEGHEEKANVVRALCGVPLPEPKWMQQARAAGWTPPR